MTQRGSVTARGALLSRTRGNHLRARRDDGGRSRVTAAPCRPDRRRFAGVDRREHEKEGSSYDGPRRPTVAGPPSRLPWATRETCRPPVECTPTPRGARGYRQSVHRAQTVCGSSRLWGAVQRRWVSVMWSRGAAERGAPTERPISPAPRPKEPGPGPPPTVTWRAMGCS